jgi:hypothetical protein
MTEIADKGKTRWEVPELVATGTAAASVGVFVCFFAAALDVAIRAPRFETSTVAIRAGAEWVYYAVPLLLFTVLAAWWVQNGQVTTRRRLRPSLLVAAILGLLSVAADLALLIDTLVNLRTGGPGRIATLASTAGLSIVGLVGGAVIWLAAIRLLRPVGRGVGHFRSGVC